MTQVAFMNPRTGKIKDVKIGWSWTLFFFSGFALPLFLRQLYVWGGVIVASWIVVELIALPMEEEPETLFSIFSWALFGLSIWFAIKGNEMTAKNYLNHGWVFASPEGDAAQLAKQKWNIAR
jgi:hypothetical protein